MQHGNTTVILLFFKQRATKVALEGNTGMATQFDGDHVAPLLAPPTPSSAYQQWIFTRVP